MKEKKTARTVYGDIIDLPRPVSRKHPPMPRMNRAAQFAPFAALTGYDDLIREAERFTDRERELDESAKEEIGEKLLFLSRAEPSPEAVFTYFVADGKKEGGAYVTRCARLSRLDELDKTAILDDGTAIAVGDLLRIEGDFFSSPAE